MVISLNICVSEDGKYFKHWEERWFFTEPQLFLMSHLPFAQENQVDILNQDTDEPYMDIDSWEHAVALDPVCAAFGIRPLSHLDGVVIAKKNEVLLMFSCQDADLTFTASLRHLDGSDYSQLHTITYSVKGGFHVLVLCPTRGRYKLQIGCTIETVVPSMDGPRKQLLPLPSRDQQDKKSTWIPLMVYVIEALSSHEFPTLPVSTNDNRWGLSVECRKAGLIVPDYESGIIQADGGIAKLVLNLPASTWCPVVYKLKNVTQEDLHKYIYGDKRDNTLTLYTMCPTKGLFVLEIWMRTTISDSFDLCSRFLVVSSKRAKAYPDAFQRHLKAELGKGEGFPPHPQGDMMGLTEHAWDIGLLSMHPSSSTIVMPEGAATITMMAEQPVKLLPVLYPTVGKELDCSRHISIQHYDDTIRIHIVLDCAGLYRLRLVGDAAEDSQLFDVCNILLVCSKPWRGPFFSKEETENFDEHF